MPLTHMTQSVRKEDAQNDWYVVDATGVPLGRLSSVIASRLRGKHKPSFTSHIDNGDNIVVINAEKVGLTGRKLVQHNFFYHTGYPGGIREVRTEDELAGKHPERVVERGVKRMIPRGPLGRKMFKKLHVYAGTEHPHTAQNPQTLDVQKIVAKESK